MIENLLRAFRSVPLAAICLLLSILGLVFLVAATWTVARADLGTTLGLASTGLAFLVMEWRIS